MTIPVINRIFAHRLACNGAGGFVEDDGRSAFNVAAYSRMKYGEVTATRHFGKLLAETLITAQPEVLSDETPTDFLVAYKAVPPACHYLSLYCLDHINAKRAVTHREPGRLLQIYKSRVAVSNYAAASQEARQQELNTIAFTLEGRSLCNNPFVLIDDVRITGAAEQKILEVLLPAAPQRLTLLYLACLQKDAMPQMEDVLNAAAVRCLADIAAFIRADNFDLNIRTLKRILSSPPAELADFLTGIPVRMLEQLLRGTLATGVAFTTHHDAGYRLLSAVWRERTGATDHAL
jgi:hypothetical protein